ncbi:unnamed protein product, partial [Sphagnum compactum]
PLGQGADGIKHGSGPHLGPKSVIKNENNPSDRPVGGKFLERADKLSVEVGINADGFTTGARTIATASRQVQENITLMKRVFGETANSIDGSIRAIKSYTDSTAKIGTSLDALKRAQDSFVQGLNREFETLGLNKRQLQEYTAQQLGLGAQTAIIIKQIDDKRSKLAAEAAAQARATLETQAAARAAAIAAEAEIALNRSLQEKIILLREGEDALIADKLAMGQYSEETAALMRQVNALTAAHKEAELAIKAKAEADALAAEESRPRKREAEEARAQAAADREAARTPRPTGGRGGHGGGLGATTTLEGNRLVDEITSGRTNQSLGTVSILLRSLGVAGEVTLGLVKVENEPERVVRVSLLYNPFLINDVAKHELVYSEGKTLAEYLNGLPDEVEWAVAYNGEHVEPEDWASIIPHPESYILIVRVPEGGGGNGGGKQILRMVAMLGVIIAAAYLAGPLVGMLGSAFGGTAGLSATAISAFTAGATAALATAGGMIVNALLPASTVNPSGNSPSYSISGPKNTSQEGIQPQVIQAVVVTPLGATGPAGPQGPAGPAGPSGSGAAATALTYAPLASPALTGTPTAPTATAGANTTQIATTAFVTGALASYPTTTTITSTYAPLASPALTGTPTAPTATPGTSGTEPGAVKALAAGVPAVPQYLTQGATAATGSFTLAAIPQTGDDNNDQDSVTVAGVEFDFLKAGDTTSGVTGITVTVGSSLAATATALAAAITAAVAATTSGSPTYPSLQGLTASASAGV